MTTTDRDEELSAADATRTARAEAKADKETATPEEEEEEKPTATAEKAASATPRAAASRARATRTPTRTARRTATAESRAASEGDEVAFRTMLQGPVARYRDEKPKVIAITSADDLEADLVPVLPRGVGVDVDFAKDLVLGAFLGQKATTGYSIEVESIAVEDGKLVVAARMVEPDDPAEQEDSKTSPFQLVRVARSEIPSSMLRDLAAEIRLLEGR